MQTLAARSFLSGNNVSVGVKNQQSSARKVLSVESKQESRTERNRHRHMRMRNKFDGTPERPRLAVFRSNNHIHAQVIDDSVGHTLAAMSTLNTELKQSLSTGADKTAAAAVGEKLAAACLEKGIKTVVFDRGGFLYHGRVQALAEAAREGGLVF
mmetsp:Transcript_13421/g.18344  ORF Transcript_13421/g.18344 Transcript_13421/m.18344 type:complete len:155 (-) Transcript_13421:320-784(-)|eukprot:CAMPEP_0196586778 /NCGR_PEP_ID=MMETSP1081-20130531/55517_1 /TAXON_ID=36882 /ORGANISM="Pyramimonas amylifera, Strain CCMP720" /LENGTH=154 /DNA_ID=CAMNT_0041908765 /DNA_START=70 /DNA_END=534 /DNA_ORIENTATION=+